MEKLEGFLEEDENLPKKRRRTAQLLYEDIRGLGYEGAYDSVRRHVKKWRQERRQLSAPVFI